MAALPNGCAGAAGSAAQNKVPRVISDPELFADLREFADEYTGDCRTAAKVGRMSEAINRAALDSTLAECAALFRPTPAVGGCGRA